MALTFSIADVRKMILIDDEDVISDTNIQFYMDITTTEINTSDVLAKLYHTAWKLASSLSWDKISSANGVSWEKSNPDKFKELYESRLNQLGSGYKPKKVNWEKSDTQQY